MLCSPLVWGFCLLPTLDSLSPLSRDRLAGTAGMAGITVNLSWSPRHGEHYGEVVHVKDRESLGSVIRWVGVGQGEGLRGVAGQSHIQRQDRLLVPSGLAGRVKVAGGHWFWRDSVCLVLTGPGIPLRTGRNSHRLGGRGHHPCIWKPVLVTSFPGKATMLCSVQKLQCHPPARPRAAVCALLSPSMGQGRFGSSQGHPFPEAGMRDITVLWPADPGKSELWWFPLLPLKLRVDLG